MDQPSTSSGIGLPEAHAAHTSYDFDTWLANANSGLFLSFTGYSIDFFFELPDLDTRRNFEKIVTAFGGSCISEYADVTSSTVVLVDEKPKSLSERPVFNVKYIADCVAQNVLLDISDYAYFSTAKNFKGTFMDVIFWRKLEFTVNRENEKSVVTRCHKRDRKPVDMESESSADTYKLKPINKTKSTTVQPKNTRNPYSMAEKEAILKFLVVHGKYDNLKGPSVWRTMERRNVCPKRTYQSMKEHFAKRIVHELDRFIFLTEKQKSLLRNGFSVCK